MSKSGAGTNRVARATFRIVFTRRAGFRLPRLVVDLRFVAAKVIRRLRRRRGERKSNPSTQIWKTEFDYVVSAKIRVIRGQQLKSRVAQRRGCS